MRILVGIQGHAAAQVAININSWLWTNARCDVIALDGCDAPAEWWPAYIVGRVTSAIRNGRWLGYGFRPTLLVDSLCALVKLAEGHYDAILWTECDSIFLGPIPSGFDGSKFNAVVAGFCPPEWHCGSGPFLHPPFLMSMNTAMQWSNAASTISTESGNGTPDVFAALVCESAGIKIASLQNVWSCNGLDMRLQSKMIAARQAANNGCWHIHGIKRKDHLDYILGITDEHPADTIFDHQA